MLFRQLRGLAHHAAAALGGRRQDHLGAVGAHQLAPFDREGFGHHRDERIAARGGDHRQGDAGVAGGRLHDRLAGLEQALALGVEHDRQRQAVLDRAAGIERLDLRVERDVRRRDAMEPDDRRVADGVEDAVVEGHGCSVEEWRPEGGTSACARQRVALRDDASAHAASHAGATPSGVAPNQCSVSGQRGDLADDQQRRRLHVVCARPLGQFRQRADDDALLAAAIRSRPAQTASTARGRARSGGRAGHRARPRPCRRPASAAPAPAPASRACPASPCSAR